MRVVLEKWGVPALFLIYLALGLAIHGDYGISWDEPWSRTNGLVNLRHVSELWFGPVSAEALLQQPALADWSDRDYGVAFELPLAAAEQWLGLKDAQVFRFRHLATFLFFALGVAALYQAACAVRGSRWMGLAAALMLVLSPRMFGESFYNSKDIVFMAACAMALFTLERFLRRRSWGSAVLHGFVMAIAIDIRIMGVVMPAVTLGAWLVLMLQGGVRPARGLALAGAWLLSLMAFTYALFPYLWSHPVDHFAQVFGNMSRFRWNGEVLYLGEFVSALQLPWHYIPVWMGVTIPLPITLFMLLGTGLTLAGLVRSRWRLWTSHDQMMDLICLALLVGPVLAVIVLKSVLYDGWRQLYFVYPAFVMLAVKGLDVSWQLLRGHRLAHRAFVATLVVVVLYQAQWMVRAHPLQNVYFNELVRGPWKDRFDLDYWGLGNREALEHILRHDNSPFITVSAGSRTVLETSFPMLPAAQQARLLIVDSELAAMYVVNNYRLVRDRSDTPWLKDHELFWQKRIGDQPIVSVYRLRDPSTAVQMSRSDRPYTGEQIRPLTLEIVGRKERADHSEVELVLNNPTDTRFSALSASGNQLAITWRFRDAAGQPVSGWDGRMDLPVDLPPRGQLRLRIGIDPWTEVDQGQLEVDLFQTRLFWAHQVGGTPAVMAWTRRPAAQTPP